MDNEEELIQQARYNPDAFAKLYDHYVERIYLYAQRKMGNAMLAEDIVATTFEKAWKNLPRYRWQGTNFGSWLYKIAHNEMKMSWRKKNWFIPLWDHLRSQHNVEKIVQEKGEALALIQAIRQLSQRDQDVLFLCYFENLPYKEIGLILGCSADNVSVRLHRALKRLHKQMMKQSNKKEVPVNVRSHS